MCNDNKDSATIKCCFAMTWAAILVILIILLVHCMDEESISATKNREVNPEEYEYVWVMDEDSVDNCTCTCNVAKVKKIPAGDHNFEKKPVISEERESVLYQCTKCGIYKTTINESNREVE